MVGIKFLNLGSNLRVASVADAVLPPVMNSHVAPLSEPTHGPNKHTTALRTNGSPLSRSGAAIACPEELWI